MTPDLKHEVETHEPHSIEAVVTLARMMGFAEIPEVLKINDTLALVIGSNGYYSIHKEDGQPWRCSCKAASFGRICKHLRTFSAFMREVSRKGEFSAFDTQGNIKMVRTGFRPILEEVV